MNDLNTLVSEQGTVNSSQEAVEVAQPVASTDSLTSLREINFSFKGKRNEAGEIVKRNSLTLKLPILTFAGITAILETGIESPEYSLLSETLERVITDQARALITADPLLTADTLPIDKLSWAAIARIPKAERSGGGISKEIWEAFCVDFITVMQAAAGKTEAQALKAASILKGKFSAVKTNKPVLNALVAQLSTYAENTEKLEEFMTCVEALITKADALLNASDEDLLTALG